MRAYYLNFREEIIQVYENEAISQRQITKRFCVALSFIEIVTQLDEAIQKAYQQVSEQDLLHWFTHCCYYISFI